MDPSDTTYGLRLALSYAEKARASMDDCRRALDAGQIDQARHDSVTKFCRLHLKRAVARLRALRKAEGRHLAGLERQLNACLVRQARLSKRVAKGRVGLAEANEANRTLTQNMARLKTESVAVRAAIDAPQAQNLGGFVDLLLEEYVEKLKTIGPRATAKFAIPVRSASALAITAVLVTAGFVGLRILPARGNVSFEAAMPDSASHRIEVTCRNNGRSPVVFHVPWPEDGTMGPSSRRVQIRSFGIQVYVTEKGDDALRFVPNTGGCWSHLGLPMAGRDPIALAQGISKTVVMDADRLQDSGVDAKSVLLVFTRGDGREVGRFETGL